MCLLLTFHLQVTVSFKACVAIKTAMRYPIFLYVYSNRKLLLTTDQNCNINQN